MTSKQMDIFEYLKTETKTKSPDHMLAILDSVNGIKSKKFKVSAALDAVADILAGKSEPKDRRFKEFVYRVGRAIKPEILRIEKVEREEAVRDAADAQLCFDGLGQTCGSPASLDEFKELVGV